MIKDRKTEIFEKTKSIINERGYGVTNTDDEAYLELMSIGTEMGRYADEHPSFETVAKISNIIISLNELHYDYSLKELMYMLSLSADDVQAIYRNIRDGKYGKIKVNENYERV